MVRSGLVAAVNVAQFIYRYKRMEALSREIITVFF